MSEKALALIGDNPELKIICERIQQRKGFMAKQLENLQNKAEEIQENNIELDKPDWEEVEAIVKDRLPSNFNEATHYIGFNMETGVVYYEKKGEEMPSFIRAMFDGKFPN